MANENMPPKPNVPASVAPSAPGATKPPIPPIPGAKPGAAPGTPGAPVPAAPETHEVAVPMTFWQLPWVQNILPFATSVIVHVGILIIGVVFFFGVQYINKQSEHQDEVIIPDAQMVDNGPPGGIPNQGLGKDPQLKAMQDQDPTESKPEGWANKKGTAIDIKAAGGGDGDNNDTTIGISAIGGNMGRGQHGKGAGNGNFSGAGDGDGSGPLAPFGQPGGGGIGPHGPVFGHGGNAHRIAFVCDASGSMLNKFSTLRRELTNTIQGLKPIQSFNLIFFQEQNKSALSDGGLIMATPENKLKATNYLEDKVTPRGETNPIPGIELAFQQKPDLIYLLTDGDFPDNKAVLKRIQELNRTAKIKINTIAFIGESDTDTEFKKILQQIAKESGGNYNEKKESDL